MGMIFALSFESNDFEGSGFALWRHLWLRRLAKEVYALPKGSLHLLKLPISVEEFPYIGPRNRKLLYRRLEQMIPKETPCLFSERARDCLFEYNPQEDKESLQRLGALALPAVLQTMHRQWGATLFGEKATIVSEHGEFLPLMASLAPFVKSVDVVTNEIPRFEEQGLALEEWGITVCFREKVSDDSRLFLLWDTKKESQKIPSSAISIDFTGQGNADISPRNIFFHVPPAYGLLSSTIGGIHLGTLSLLAQAMYGGESAEESILKEGFEVSRVEKPMGKKWKNYIE